jgi:hypothetical protein
LKTPEPGASEDHERTVGFLDAIRNGKRPKLAAVGDTGVVLQLTGKPHLARRRA